MPSGKHWDSARAREHWVHMQEAAASPEDAAARTTHTLRDWLVDCMCMALRTLTNVTLLRIGKAGYTARNDEPAHDESVHERGPSMVGTRPPGTRDIP